MFYDLCVRTSEPSVLKKAASLGWNSVCVTLPLAEASKIKLPEKVDSMEVYSGVLVDSNVQKNARKALDFADLIIVQGGSDDINREASECWEVDILLNPELDRGHDKMDFKNAGLDHVIAKFMSERGIALGVEFNRLLDLRGGSMVKELGRVQQNVRIALKYKVPVVLVSGAVDNFGLRTPQDLIAVHNLLGVPDHEASKIISKYPEMIVNKVKLRNNPDVITKGLEVTNWGKQERKPNRKYGWY